MFTLICFIHGFQPDTLDFFFNLQLILLNRISQAQLYSGASSRQLMHTTVTEVTDMSYFSKRTLWCALLVWDDQEIAHFFRLAHAAIQTFDLVVRCL